MKSPQNQRPDDQAKLATEEFIATYAKSKPRSRSSATRTPRTPARGRGRVRPEHRRADGPPRAGRVAPL
jgi:hypothetical protein